MAPQDPPLQYLRQTIITEMLNIDSNFALPGSCSKGLYHIAGHFHMEQTFVDGPTWHVCAMYEASKIVV